MCTFIEDYLKDPAQAIISARDRASVKFGNIDFNDEDIYKSLASPEFRLYEEIVFSEISEDAPYTGGYVSVA
jgi:hypothetical protein